MALARSCTGAASSASASSGTDKGGVFVCSYGRAKMEENIFRNPDLRDAVYA